MSISQNVSLTGAAVLLGLIVFGLHALGVGDRTPFEGGVPAVPLSPAQPSAPGELGGLDGVDLVSTEKSEDQVTAIRREWGLDGIEISESMLEAAAEAGDDYWRAWSLTPDLCRAAEAVIHPHGTLPLLVLAEAIGPDLSGGLQRLAGSAVAAHEDRLKFALLNPSLAEFGMDTPEVCWNAYESSGWESQVVEIALTYGFDQDTCA